ncbi:hypothetical protein Hdeb2414_s0026g00675821 [Helianthus debilis subsp. tardiflorus]
MGEGRSMRSVNISVFDFYCVFIRFIFDLYCISVQLVFSFTNKNGDVLVLISLI